MICLLCQPQDSLHGTRCATISKETVEVMAKRGSARAVRLTCPKCASKFTIVAFLSQAITAAEYWRQRSEEHDCDAHAKAMAAMRNSDGTKNPLKASKAAAKGK